MIFKRFFKPYAEYCLRTTLSEDELKNALEKELPQPWLFPSRSSKTGEITFVRTDNPMTLRPITFFRDTLDPVISIRCRKPEAEGETVLDITIIPEDSPWKVRIVLFCLILWIAALPYDIRLRGIFVLAATGLLLVILAFSRAFVDAGMPEIQSAFENTLRQLEKKYKEK